MRSLRDALLVICLVPAVSGASGRRAPSIDPTVAAAVASVDLSGATGATASFSPCPDVSYALPVGAQAELDLGLIDSGYSGSALAISVQEDHIDLDVRDGAYLAWGEVSLSGEVEVYGASSDDVKPDNCFFKHVCRELCDKRTVAETGSDYADGGSGYVLGCLLAEAALRAMDAS